MILKKGKRCIRSRNMYPQKLAPKPLNEMIVGSEVKTPNLRMPLPIHRLNTDAQIRRILAKSFATLAQSRRVREKCLAISHKFVEFLQKDLTNPHIFDLFEQESFDEFVQKVLTNLFKKF
jgi:hypothetical protein